MDDMTAFERQLSAEIGDLMGPVHPVDDLAIFDAIASANQEKGRGFTMFSAFKFAAAAVVVALFGGFLLTGVLGGPQGDEMAPAAVSGSPSPATTEASSPPQTTEDLLSKLLAEEIQPGILRVDSDGVRFLSSADNRDVVAGYDGGIWLLRENGFLRVGSDTFHEWPTDVVPDRPGVRPGVFEVTPGGEYWAFANVSEYLPDARWGHGSRSSDGEAWTTEPCPTHDCTGMTVAPDGTVWASWVDEGGAYRVGYLGPDGWEPLDGYVPANWSPGVFDRFFFTDAGDLYGVNCMWACSLYHHEDGTWHRSYDFSYAVDVGPDGTVWGMEGDRWHDGLARFADGEWSRWTEDELPDLRWLPRGESGPLGVGFGDEFQVAPDGSLWAGLWRSGGGIETTDPDLSTLDREERFAAIEDGRAACDGIVRFDGESVDHFLAGRCGSMDIAADGSVWVLAESEDEYMVDGVLERMLELYVITADAISTAGVEPPPPPTSDSAPADSTEGLLSGMVTEEVEPGVLRVVNDGYRDVSQVGDGLGRNSAVMVGASGEVWRITPPRRLFRLGQEEEWDYDPALVEIRKDNTEATRDGRLWTVAVPVEYRIFEDGSWGYPIVEFGQHYETLATQADGTVWLLAEDSHLRVLRGGEDVDVIPSWRDVYDGDNDWMPPKLAVTDAGEAWLVDRGGSDNFHDFLRFDGDSWQVVAPPIDTAADPAAYWSWDVGPDGTMWAMADALGVHETLARLDEDGWTIFTEADGVRPWGQQPMGFWGTDIVRVAQDGSVWVNATDAEARTCDGLARFDGESWIPFLAGSCISDLDFAPDGSLWVVAWEPSSDATHVSDTYVITPEAVEGQP